MTDLRAVGPHAAGGGGDGVALQHAVAVAVSHVLHEVLHAVVLPSAAGTSLTSKRKSV